MKTTPSVLILLLCLVAGRFDAGAVTVAFTTATTNVDEGQSIWMHVRLSAVTNRNVTVSYSRSGTASASGVGTELDILMSGTSPITIRSNTLQTNILITTFHTSSYDESNETVVVTLSAPVNATLGSPSVCTATIIDNDPPPTLSWSGSTGGPETTTAPTMELSANSGKPITVSYAVTGGTASNGVDYTVGATTLTIPPDRGGTNIPVTIVNDLMDEDSETIVLSMTSANNATLPGTAFRDRTYTISDNDNAPAISFATASASGSESGDTSVSVNLSTPSSRTITGTILNSGTARGSNPNLDYTFTPANFSLPPGSSGTNILINIVNDTRDETNETIVLNLHNVNNATETSPSTYTYTINDNDNPPNVAFADNVNSGYESNAPMVSVLLTQTSDLAPSVDYAVLGGTASNGVDYVLAAGTLVFAATNSALPIPFTLIHDGVAEGSETILLELSNPTNCALGVFATNQFTILDTGNLAVSFPLTMSLTPSNTVLISWPSPATGFGLQQNTNVNTTNWVASGETGTDDGTNKTVIVSPTTGHRFYRLFKP